MTPENIRITETNFTGNVFNVNGSSKNLKNPILRIPEISTTKNGRIEIIVETNETGPNESAANIVMVAIGAHAPSVKMKTFKPFRE